MKALIAFVILAMALAWGGVRLAEGAQTVIHLGPGPHPTRTPQPDKGVLGLPQPSPVPSCVAGKAFEYADENGCIYACAGGKTVILAVPLNNTCAQPTTGATATPTATATATETATPTVTVTVTPTPEPT